MFDTLCGVYMPLGTWAEVQAHSYHALTHVCVGSCMCCVVVCVARKPRPCRSYSRHRDRINLVLLRSYYKKGGKIPTHACPSYSRHRDRINLVLLRSCYKRGGKIPTHAWPAVTATGTVVYKKDGSRLDKMVAKVVFEYLFPLRFCVARRNNSQTQTAKQRDSLGRIEVTRKN